MPPKTRRIPPLDAKCFPAPLVALAQAAAQNALVQEGIEALLNQLANVGGPYLDNHTAQHYLDLGQHTGRLSNASNPIRGIELFADYDVGDGGALVKFLEWNGTAYAVTGDEFLAYDIFGKWKHSLDGDKGTIAWDARRKIWYIEHLNSPLFRDGTIGSALGRDGTATFTDATSSQTLTVYGRYVRTGMQAPSGARVGATWCPYANSYAGRWYAFPVDECLEETA